MNIMSPPSRFVRKICSKVLPPDAGHDIAERAACVVAAALEQAFLRRPDYNYCLHQDLRHWALEVPRMDGPT